MNGYLLDTNVVFEAVRKLPDVNVGRWFKSVPASMLHLSVLTIGEIRKGIILQVSAARRTQLESWLQVDVLQFFNDRILPVDTEVSDRWGSLSANAKTAGKILPTVDALLAATALQHDLVLVTRNTRDVRTTGVSTLNPWIA